MKTTRGLARGVGFPQGPIGGARAGSSAAGKIGTDVPDDSERYYTEKGYTVVEFDLTAARDSELWEVPGTFIWAPTGSDAAAQIDVTLNDIINDGIPFLPGTKVSGIPFRRLYLTNEAQAGETITLMIAADLPADRIDTDA